MLCLKIKQGEIAQALRLDQSDYGKAERGLRSLTLEQIRRLREVYNVNTNWLMYGEGEMFVSPVVEAGEVEEIKAFLRENPEIRKLMRMAKTDKKAAIISRIYQKLALKHIKVSEKQLEEKFELFLRMAKSLPPKCPRCEHHSFELVEYDPKGSKYKIMLVQCASCGTVVGTLDYYNAGILVRALAEKLKIDLD